MQYSSQVFQAVADADAETPTIKFWSSVVRPAFAAAVNAQTPRDKYKNIYTYRRAIARMRGIRILETEKPANAAPH